MEGNYQIKLRAVAYFADSVNIKKLFVDVKMALKVFRGKKFASEKGTLSKNI
jgi:hypothetical protein